MRSQTMQRGTHSFDSIAHDLIHGCRVLWHCPAVLIGAVAVFGLTFAASVALLSLLDRLLIRPLPVDHPHRLVQLLQPTGDENEPTIYPKTRNLCT